MYLGLNNLPQIYPATQIQKKYWYLLYSENYYKAPTKRLRVQTPSMKLDKGHKQQIDRSETVSNINNHKGHWCLVKWKLSHDIISLQVISQTIW